MHSVGKLMRLNLGNETELYMVAADLECEVRDLYVAVAMVGDKLDDVRRFLARNLHHRALDEAPCA
jgi:hypothetical protein